MTGAGIESVLRRLAAMDERFPACVPGGGSGAEQFAATAAIAAPALEAAGLIVVTDGETRVESFVRFVVESIGGDSRAIPAGAFGHAAFAIEQALDRPAEEVFDPPLTPKQRMIVDALAGRSLGVEPLADACGFSDSAKLYRNGLKDLERRGIVRKLHGAGYYMPRFPPPELASLRQESGKDAKSPKKAWQKMGKKSA